MLQYTPEDIVALFDKAKNLNAAVKKFLKNEVANNVTTERFAKAAKAALLSPVPGAKVAFVTSHLPDYEPHLLVLARYAHLEVITEITVEVVTKYADDFNTSYTNVESVVTVTDEKKFKKIVLEVQDIVDAGIKKHALPGAPFLKKVVLYNIFDKEVLEKVLPLLA